MERAPQHRAQGRPCPPWACLPWALPSSDRSPFCLGPHLPSPLACWVPCPAWSPPRSLLALFPAALPCPQTIFRTFEMTLETRAERLFILDSSHTDYWVVFTHFPFLWHLPACPRPSGDLKGSTSRERDCGSEGSTSSTHGCSVEDSAFSGHLVVVAEAVKTPWGL